MHVYELLRYKYASDLKDYPACSAYLHNLKKYFA